MREKAWQYPAAGGFGLDQATLEPQKRLFPYRTDSQPAHQPTRVVNWTRGREVDR